MAKKRAVKKAMPKPPCKTPMYLVVARHEMDDVPVILSDSEFYAIGVASCCDPMGTAKARKAMNTDCSTPVCVVVLEFVDGEPSKIVYQRDL